MKDRADVRPKRTANTCEWWELWWVKPGEAPVFIRMYGGSVPQIPDGSFPTRELALEEKLKLGNKYVRICHVRRTQRLTGKEAA
jgi:hypothetical protein